MLIPENKQLILQNATIIINETIYPMLKVQVIPGQLSDPLKLKFNWTLVDFSVTKMQIKL